MANEEHLKILRQGVAVWNAWRVANPGIRPDLSEADLARADLTMADLARADLTIADLTGAILIGVVFNRTTLAGTDLTGANLTGASFTKADCCGAIFTRSILNTSNLTDAYIGSTIFSNVDLSETIGLDTVDHFGPSTIGVDTLYLSRGKIPEAFLRGCGVPDTFIEYLPSLLGAEEVIKYSSCFISYSHQDEDFARRLHSRLRDNHLRVWYAPEDMQGGKKLHEQIFEAIHVYDKFLIVLSERSINSAWVLTEIRRARKAERATGRRKLFPIRLVDFAALQAWECFDAETGNDLAVEVREYFIPDFSHWQDHDAFEAAFARLLRDLQESSTKV